MKRFKKWWFVLLLVLLVALGGYSYFQNNAIETSSYQVSHNLVPESFDGFKIAHVSDLHNKDFNGRLTEKIIAEQPDIIAVTGDLIDRNRTDLQHAVDMMEQFIAIAPVYFVSGNHEIASGEYDELRDELDQIGVINLDNDFAVIEEAGEQLALIGLEDPLLLTNDEITELGSGEAVIEQTLNELIEAASTDYTVLLSHRAELMEIYVDTSIDLALTGHAHGGQIRLPFIEGLYSPSQGFFPEYTSGLYEESSTQMIVSRGLGNSIFPFRINNRPDLVVLTLRAN